MVARAPLPSRSGVTGTSRQPRTVRFSSAAMASICSTATACAVPSAGRKAMPTAQPASGSSNPATSRRNASGTWDRIPAPSPESGSDPVAPRCSRFRNTVRACSTSVWLASPVRLATKPTPQASCSLRGSYMPCWAGRPSMGDQAVVLRPVAECVDAERIGSPVVVVAYVRAEGRRWPSAKFRAGYMMTAIPRSGYGVSPCGHRTQQKVQIWRRSDTQTLAAGGHHCPARGALV